MEIQTFPTFSASESSGSLDTSSWGKEVFSHEALVVLGAGSGEDFVSVEFG